ncbi:fructosamine kinase family protein [Oenococcus sp.]|uniref:fructosamine kinase family protein n=1 Tax=Oenococcus sp. TaxID=1979414 RepID=UPI0039EB584D
MFTLSREFLQKVPTDSPVVDFQEVHGGDINRAYALTDSKGQRYFLKVQPKSVPEFFQHEADGLRLLGQAARVPKVLALGEVGKDQWLLLEYLHTTNSGDQYALGQGLAKIHAITSPNHKFGLDSDFKAGKTIKINSWQSDWTNFFIEQRLNVLRRLLISEGKWQDDNAYAQAISIFRELMAQRQVQPSLLHGDFWAGNFMFDADNGEAIFIDPDVYYGDSEFDIGITTVFGGFTRDFYAGYQSIRPFQAGVDQRLMFYQLYYLMVHAHLFSGSYISAYRGKLRQIISQ